MTAEYLDRLAELDAMVARAQPGPDILVERAAGLLAGRGGCRVNEAHGYLVQLAAERGRDAHELAAELLRTLEGRAAPAELGPPRVAVDQGLVPGGQAGQEPTPLSAGSGTEDDWGRLMQQVLDAVPGNHTALLPVRDDAGAVVDFRFVAVSPSVVGLSARRSTQFARQPGS